MNTQNKERRMNMPDLSVLSPGGRIMSQWLLLLSSWGERFCLTNAHPKDKGRSGL